MQMNTSLWDNCSSATVDLESSTNKYISKVIDSFFSSLRGIYYHRYLTDFVNAQEFKSVIQLQHIIFTHGCFLDIAVINWAKLFGSKNEKTHFMHLIKYSELQDYLSVKGFIDEYHLEHDLLNYLVIHKNEFDDYKKESIIKYRDKYISHNDIDILLPLEKYPKFDIAEKALFWLYELAVDLIKFKQSINGNRKFAIFNLDEIKRQINKEANILTNSIIYNHI